MPAPPTEIPNYWQNYWRAEKQEQTFKCLGIWVNFATLPLLTLSWFQILLTGESPAQGLIICTQCYSARATNYTKCTSCTHYTFHTIPFLCNKTQCTNAEAGLGKVWSEVHMVGKTLVLAPTYPFIWTSWIPTVLSIWCVWQRFSLTFMILHFLVNIHLCKSHCKLQNKDTYVRAQRCLT